MKMGNNTVFHQIDQLILEGKLDQAKNNLDDVKQDKLENLDKIHFNLLNAKISLLSNNYDRTLKIVNQILQNNDQISQLMLFSTLELKSIALCKTHNFGEILELIDQLSTITESFEFEENYSRNHFQSVIHFINGLYHRYTNNLELAIEEYNLCIIIRKEGNMYTQLAEPLNHLGIIYHNIGKTAKSIEYYEQSLEIYNQIGDQKYIIGVQMNIALVFEDLQMFDKALQILLKCRRLSEKRNDLNLLASITTNIGLVLIGLGNLELALKYFLDNFKLLYDLGNKLWLQRNYMNAGITYNLMWELDKAREFFNKSIELSTEIVDDFGLAKSLHNMGLVERKEENYKLAIFNFERSNDIYESMNNKINQSEALYDLIMTSILMKNQVSIDKYYKMIVEIDNKNNERQVNILSKLSKALILKSKDRFVHKTQAQQIYYELVENENIDYEFRLDALLNLCDILMLEIKSTQSIEATKELYKLIYKIELLNKGEPPVSLTIDVQILKSKIAFILGDINVAVHSINEAVNLANKSNLEGLQEKVRNEKEFLENNLIEMQIQADKGAAMLNLKDKANENYIDFLKRNFG